MKKCVFTLLFLLAISGFVLPQITLLSEDIKGDTLKDRFGPNQMNFIHFYIGASFVTPSMFENDETEINYGKSWDFLLGIRYKLKICKFWAIGLEMQEHSTTFNIKQTSSKIVLYDSIYYHNECLRFYQMGAGIYNRINYGRCGNRICKFIDIGASGDWVYLLIYKNKLKFEDEVDKTKVRYRKLPEFCNDLNYGVFARIGFNRYVLTGYYRLSDLFFDGQSFQEQNPSTTIYPEFPRFLLGLQIGIHR